MTFTFTGCFLLFYLLIPFLNKLIHALTKKEHFWLMAWCLGVYVILPSFARASVTFNYITWFSILFIIASYIRYYPKDWFSNTKIAGTLMAVSLILSWGSVAVLATLSRMVRKNIGISYFFVSDSNKILALATSVSAFLFFKNIKIRYSKIINTIASSTFGVLLIHANSNTMRQWLWHNILNNVGIYKSGNVLLHAVASVILIYAACTVVDFYRIKLFGLICKTRYRTKGGRV